MAPFIIKTGRVITKGALGLVAVLFVALIAIQLLLVVGINLVSTGRGSYFIAGKVNEALADSGYRIDFDSLYYDPVRGFTVYDLSVSDPQGEFLKLDRFSLSISFILSPLRTIDVHAKGGTLAVYRIPASAEEEQETQSSIQPFDMPDIYFRKVILSNLSFDHVVLAEEIAGTPYNLSPSLRAQMTFNHNIGLKMTLRPGMQDLAEDIPAPENIYLDGSMTPSTLAFTLRDLSVNASSYDLSANGTGSLSRGGNVNLKARARHHDLGLLTGEAFKEASVDVTVFGKIARPAIDLSASLITGSLKERGLSDIGVVIKTEDVSEGLKGKAGIHAVFQKEPVTLESDVSYGQSVLSFTSIKGSAPALSLQGSGNLSTEKFLFDGKITLSAENLARYSELAGITLAGKFEATGTFNVSDDEQQILDVSAVVTGGTFDNVKVKKMAAQASFASLSTPWPQSASLELSALQIGKDAAFGKVNAAITEAGEEKYKLSIKGDGRTPVAVSFDGSALLSDLTEEIPSAHNIAMNLKSGRSSINLSGDLTPKRIDLKLSAKDFRARDLPAPLPEQLETSLINLNASMTGTPGTPQTELNASMDRLGAGPYQNASLMVEARHDSKNLSMILTGKGTGIRALKADVSAPLVLSLLPFQFTLDQGAPLSGTIAANVDLEALSPLFLPPTQKLSGSLSADGTIAGTIGKPAPSASLRLNNVNFEDQENSIVIADLKAAAAITQDSLTLTSLSATDGKKGAMSGNGSLSFTSGETDIGLRLHDFNIPQGNLADGIISSDLSLKGAGSGLHLSGKTDITEMNILIPETFSNRIPQLNIIESNQGSAPGILERLTLDIVIDAHNQVFVRGWGLDAEFGGKIAVSGTGNDPQLNGSLSSRRGRFEEFGKRFTLARADLRFQGSVPPSPYLDIEATTPAGDVTGSILFTGPVQSPSIKFASTPALPEDEVLSRILFGKESARISPFQAVQLAQAIRRFSGQGGGGPDIDPLGMIRSATGLDDLSVETDESGGANVEAGKYLTDKVYLEVSKGKAENSGEATIQIEVSPSINIESQIGQDAQSGGGVFWKHEY